MAADPVLPGSAAVIGCGVIGAAWAARLRLHGVPVRAFDPSPEANRILDEVAANAVAAWSDLGLPTDMAPLTICDTIEAAVADVDLIQESVPERMDVKHATLSAVDAAAPHEAVIGSSTSGLLCSDLARPLERPERLVVAHPFNPVYLLPVVEIVGGEHTSEATIERALAYYGGVGMKPIHIKAEIEAHVADRLLEAVWREALWLVNDGIATTSEIDDAIRYGFGLRWAQMGLFETYRIAGGEGGFGHFIRQFGPALAWPWTKLVDVPELTEELIERLESQSDEQSGAYSIRELERIRDRNLAAMMLALEANDWGAGQTLAELRSRFR
ncbi:MAG: 3-hydroxyacyl-CoA dehydrogenase NAD-binding domain-containing protein [Acidimicrobiia bacterium]|nr:3-hydroxyacyl-CoA dehydrogenase NAD-binding domain-containing protein [Acidimicrobiia bacterium]